MATSSRNTALRTLGGLLLGLTAGVMLAAWSPARAPGLLAVADPVGEMWLDALKMTVVPLVLALLVSGVAGAAGTARAGGLAGRALGVFAAMLALAAALPALLVPPLLALSPPPAGLLRAIPAGVAIPPARPLGEWFTTLIPDNALKALAEGQMLQVVVFGLVLGFAVLTVDAARRATLLRGFDALADALLVVVGWVVLLAPIGVAALAFGLGARTGVAAVGALLHYVGVVSLLCLLALLAAWLLAWVWGGIAPLRFARAVAPALAVGLGTQSSLACLPLMVQAADDLGLPRAASRLTLPMAVATLRMTSPAANLAVVLYCAALFGVDVQPLALAAAVGVALLMSLTVVSLPSQITFYAALVPIGSALGVPPAAYALLIAVETIPDLFRTIGNVVADVAATAIVARGVRDDDATDA